MSAHSISIPLAFIGYAGTPADSPSGFEAVSYNCSIGKYEVTNGQYTAFLSAAAKIDPYALYNTSMRSNALGDIIRSGSAGSYSLTVQSGYENKPVVYVSWWDAARFENWAGTGDTEGTRRGAACKLNSGFPSGVAREAGAIVALPTQDEWYKPAGYGEQSDRYWLYPKMSDTVPTSATPGAGANRANFRFDDSIADGVNGDFAVTQSLSFNSSQVYLTEVGSYTDSASFFGKFDQGGNLWE